MRRLRTDQRLLWCGGVQLLQGMILRSRRGEHEAKQNEVRLVELD
jgi:hypothetical protein